MFYSLFNNWRAMLLDEENSRYLVVDSGGDQILAIDTATKAISSPFQFPESRGISFAILQRCGLMKAIIV